MSEDFPKLVPGQNRRVDRTSTSGSQSHIPSARILQGLGFGATPTWTPKVCKIMALMAIIMGLGLLFYILLGLR